MLGPVKNGVITHVTRKGGGEVEIKCHANYTLFGSSRLSCINGEWSSSIPSCKGMSHTCNFHWFRSKKNKIKKQTFTVSTWEESTWKNPLAQIREKKLNVSKRVTLFKLNRRNKLWSAAFPQCIGQNAYCSRDIYLQWRKCYRTVI